MQNYYKKTQTTIKESWGTRYGEPQNYFTPRSACKKF